MINSPKGPRPRQSAVEGLARRLVEPRLQTQKRKLSLRLLKTLTPLLSTLSQLVLARLKINYSQGERLEAIFGSDRGWNESNVEEAKDTKVAVEVKKV